MIVLYIIILIIALFIQYFIAKQFEAVAEEKGYTDSSFFHLSFWLGLPGWLLVIALPDRKDNIEKKFKTTCNTYSTEADNATKQVEENLDCTWTSGKCELCDNESDHLTHCKIVDNLGTRYRTICSDCIVKHSATPVKK